ncbi:MAG: sigma-54-dependent Fis family transcriptional regulator, partial [Anaerohalosphaera sp.]|nr:sigma-54-dependent Fis family transcriptional regulator [Anaerohalosphaera sp.]
PDSSWLEIMPEAVREIARRIGELDKDGSARIEDFPKKDQRTMEHVFLFDIFHMFNEQFDQLILDQISAGEESIEVPFAVKAISLLMDRGFTGSRACRYFALFYQIRRAYYFIQQGLTGRCASMRQLRMNLWNNIFTHDIVSYEQYFWDKMEDFSTLFLGPTGCGKGAAAAAIGRSGFIPFDEKKHRFVESFTKAFVPINLSEYPESLIESELFGHSKGAFTGAVSSHEGLFALCGGHGSIFLDEIGDVSGQVQIKLLRILQERTFSPVGSHKKLRFEGRVIAATNRSINELRSEGKFRDDFYYRLCSDCIEVPGLAQRIAEDPEELDELIVSVINRITQTGSKELADKVSDVIDKRLGREYQWPGNVRELENVIRSVIIKQDYQGDNRSNFDGDKSLMQIEIDSKVQTAEEILAKYCTILYEKFGTYEQVARAANLDRRTVKKYILRTSLKTE